MLNVVEDVNVVATKIKVVKVKNNVFCQNHAVVNVVVIAVK